MLLHTVIEEEMTGSNLCLDLTEDERYLFAAGSDSLIKVYDLTTTKIQCIKIIYLSVDIGDIFSIYYCETLKYLFVGCQNASIIWCKVDLSDIDGSYSIDRNKLPHLRYSKFFDSTGPGGRVNVGQHKKINFLNQISLCEINTKNTVHFAHYGYIYSIRCFPNDFLLLKYPSVTKFLLTGGGDGVINMWGVTIDETVKLEKLKVLENEESILSMYIHQTYLYAGLSSGEINVWDLLTFQLIKSFKIPNQEQVNCLTVVNNLIVYGNKSGLNLITDRRIFKISSDATLSLLPLKDSGFVAGGMHVVKLYEYSNVQSTDNFKLFKGELSNELMLKNLKKFVSYKTMLTYHDLYMDETRNCTKFLIKVLDNLGATSTHLIPVCNGNPVIISTFSSNNGNKHPKKLLYYGHYDVVEAEDTDNWSLDPFEMTSKNGCLYGRGTSDNKGPTLAIIHGVAELFQSGDLNVDFTFIIEGEEENGSIGFQNAVLQNLDLIGPIDHILLSNSYWLDDERPCLNYGLRGVLHCSVQIQSEKPDRHSGVDGGVLKEPTMDLIQVLHRLLDAQTNEILIPGFHKNIKALSDNELDLFKKIQDYNPKFKVDELVAKWTQPSLTIHKFEVSGPNNETIIPKTATASISIRIVPNQDIQDVKKCLLQHLEGSFEGLKSENTMTLKIHHEVEPWLGDVGNDFYKVLHSNLKKNWDGVEPLLIREGGSIPSIRFLEKTFKAPACQVPGGQASDNAHLRNEKIRVLNLFKLKDVIKGSIKDLN